MSDVKHPCSIFHYRRKEENPKQSFKQSKIEWRKCMDKKEREIILKETFRRAKERATEENVFDILKNFHVGEVREYLGILLGLEYPPSRPYLCYQYKCKSIKGIKNLSKDQKCFIKMRFNKLPFEKQLWHLKRFLDQWLGFFYKLKKFEIRNDDFFSKTLTKVAVTFTNERRKRILKDQIRRKKFVELCMPHTKCDFTDSPEPPPVMTSVQLFERMLIGESVSKDENFVRNALEKLPLIIRNSIEDKVIDFREEYQSKLLNYLRTMTDTKRKLFLGLKREYFYKLFGCDIFEEKYPNEKYPLYKRNSDDFVKKALKRKREESAEEISPSKRDSSNSDNHFDPFKLIDESLLRLKNFCFQIDSSRDSDLS